MIEANLFQYAGNNPINRKDPLGLWYLDLNVSFGTPYWFGGTGGIQINDSGIYPYLGGGPMRPGPSASLTWSPDDPTPGLNFAIQAQWKIAAQYGKDPCGKPFGEIGGGTPKGLGITAFYVFSPLTPIEYLPAP